MTTVTLNDKELATILAALRAYQDSERMDDPIIAEILAEGQLTDEEIDDLCERINFGDEP
ncbi:MAG: hypothetical protein ABSB42_07970 [Tepidisphaeraceae bacterium]|jgi:hypothetical protein